MLNIDIKNAVIGRVDDNSAVVLGFLRDPRAVVAVDMTVHKQLGLVLVEKLVEAVKAAVGDGVKVVYVPRRAVGYKYIEALVKAYIYAPSL